MTDDERYASGLFNGAVWQANWPMCWTVILTFVGDGWCLLALHKTTQRGRYALSPHHGEGDKWIFTLEEMQARLALYKWQPNRTLAPLSEELFTECFV